MKVKPLPGLPEVICVLMPQPGLGAGPKGHFQPQGHLRADTALAVDDFGETFTAHPKQLRGFGNTQSERNQDILPKNLAGMGGIVHGIHGLVSF